ncbi:U-box domain-containing protein 35-like isoform X2 [Silene latifolia]|uniref:U-box domain-containing protein 35-like isoform X2 n=1 Tax=Silene latifolia TaxID=37657 RepID=UPI003D76B194
MEIKGDEVIAVAIDKDKTSQHALKWAVDHVLMKGRIITLVHVKQRQPANPTLVGNAMTFSDINDDVGKKNNPTEGREIFLPFRCFLTRKDIKCDEVLLEGVDVSKTLVDYVTTNAIEVMVLGASSKNGFLRKFKGSDVATSVTKGAPDYCSVYVIQKGKMLSVRSATRPVPKTAGSGSGRNQTPNRTNSNDASPLGPASKGDRWPCTPQRQSGDSDDIRSPFLRGRAANGRSYGGISMPESDISFVSSRPSTERGSIDRCSFDITEFAQAPRLSNGSDIMSPGSSFSDRRSIELNSLGDYSNSSSSGFSVFSSMHMEDVETEMRKLRLELQQTMNMYNAACKEALTAKQKAIELQISKTQETQRIEAARSAEEAAMAIAEQEKAKCRAAMEAAEAAQRIAELEARKRVTAEMKAHNETDAMTKAIDVTTRTDVRYRRYSIEEIEIATEYFSESLKIGEGGYGPVYHCTLDHTSVAVKVLRPDAAQGQSQFQQEVEILCTIRHPHMVLLLGACPEYGCLVYEYMSNGSLEDRLFRRENSPPLPWQLRFRIATEIATALNFLHQSKPEPLVHRDLKPANILIDRNYVSKISDVGLARLVPPTMADNVTQYRMTQAAGTFFYIDPEYQQTGMLGTKSDIYSLGILYLQLITAKPAMGLTHHVQRALENGTFREMLDPSVPDWPYEEVLEFAKLSLACSELRRKDRPDLPQILPTLCRLREFGEANMTSFMFTPSAPSRQRQVSTAQDVISENVSTTSATSG